MLTCEGLDMKDDWGSRRDCVTAMLAQTLGIHTVLFLPIKAVKWGAAGHLAVVSMIYIIVGIPLFYMESVVGQFTGRDCLEVWHIRACLTHVGYIHIFWQSLFAIYLHMFNAFVMYYLLISFENPIPFYTCGWWKKRDCDILNFNYTVNQDCLKLKHSFPYCNDLCHSFPEYQFWRFNIMGLDKDYYYLPWRIALTSGLLCIFIFFSSFKGMRSLKWSMLLIASYPLSARFIFMIGSMLQKGIVVKYEVALDTDFSIFSREFSLSNIIAEVLYTINLGTGLAFSCASRTSFRAPCYSNSVIVVIIAWSVAILGICTTVMMTCPYAFKYDIMPGTVLKYPMTLVFEKLPRLLNAYESRSMWLILNFSFISLSASAVSVSIISSIIELISKRSARIANHRGLVSFVFSSLIFILTLPLLSYECLYFLVDVKRVVNIVAMFLVLLELVVFVLWYGLEKFCEDIHFMQGVPPKVYVKICWLISTIILVYVFCTQFITMYFAPKESFGVLVGWWALVSSIVLTILLIIVKILIGLYKKKVNDLLRIDPSWGPKSDILRRSRAMFSAQAMTKEYMYRQYHLQAGIQMRQMRSNVRNCCRMDYVKERRFE